MKEIISVIVPVYKIEKYLHRCIESILRQTYRNLEVLLVDDGSPDACPQICDAFAKKDPRVRVIHKENGGLSSARNAGLDQALGEYISFVDGDDYIHPNMIEDLYCALSESGADLAACNLQFVDEDGTEIQRDHNRMLRRETLYLDGSFSNAFQAGVVVWNKLYKKSLWETYRFREGKYHEDEFAFHHIMKQCKKMICIPNVFYYYVQHNESIMANRSAAESMDGAEAFLERMEYWRESDRTDFLDVWDEYCFRLLRDAQKLGAKKSDPARYLKLKASYSQMHHWIMGNAEYSSKIKWKCRIYWLFPVSAKAAARAKEFLRSIKYHAIYVRVLLRTKWVRMANQDKKCIFFISTPTHGNLGDQAIVYAQYQLLREIGLKGRVVEITKSGYDFFRDKLTKVIAPDDIIVIDGGGNMGTLWMAEEWNLLDIVQRFPKQSVFLFPQTAYFENSHFGRRELECSKCIYKMHSGLTVFCRDKATFELIQEQFDGVKSFYTPDMVPFLSKAQAKRNREGVLLCVREDLESVRDGEFWEDLTAQVRSNGHTVRRSSTVVDKKVTRRTRGRELRKKWREFSSARLVITDRLHGMLFCAVTGTPCIALDNVSHKIRDGHEWIDYLPYIEYCGEDVSEAIRKMEAAMANQGTYSYDRKPLEPYYGIIKEELKTAFAQKRDDG